MKNIIISFIVILAMTFFSCSQSAKQDEHAHEETAAEHAGEPEGETGHTDEIVLSPEHMQQMGIVVEPLKSGTVNASIQRPATVHFNPDNTVQVGPRIAAKVERVVVDLGQDVSKGQVLAYLSSVELGKIKAGYLSALSSYQTEKEAYRREKKLFDEKISSESEYLQAKTRYDNAEAELQSVKETLKLFGIDASRVSGNDSPLSEFTLISPIDGVVQERNLSPGQTLSPESTPIHIVNNHEMWVMVDAYERDIPVIEKGQMMELTLKSLPGERFTGKIDWVSNALDAGTRTLKVRAVVPNTAGILKDGMYGTAAVKSDKDEMKPVIPVDAVQTFENKKVVFVPADEENSFKPVEVITGKENNGWIEIAGDLRPGAMVVTRGAFELMSSLTSGSRSAAHHH